MRLLLLLVAPLSILVFHTTAVAPAGSVASGRLERWVRSGLQSLQWDQLDRCLRMSSLSEAECRQLAHLPLSAVAVYVSEPRTVAGRERKMTMVFLLHLMSAEKLLLKRFFATMSWLKHISLQSKLLVSLSCYCDVVGVENGT